MLRLTGGLFKPRAIARSAGQGLAAIGGLALWAAHDAQASWSTKLLPVLAQKAPPAEPAAETTWPILDWLIVIALVGAALYVICRSSRRN